LHVEAASAGAEYAQRFTAAMDDDFNTAGALSVLFDLANEVNRLRASNDRERVVLAGALLKSLGATLGILQNDPDAFLKGRAQGRPSGLSDDEIEALIAQRLEARRSKNWKESDRIRDQLKDAGIILEDGPSGTTWRRG
jgi:cysteinyl-tRNA synthetase